jgi:hypothetical protein
MNARSKMLQIGLLVALSLGAFSTIAQAQTLTGEVLTATSVGISRPEFTCPRVQFFFNSSGVAAGPIVGTYSESGEVASIVYGADGMTGTGQFRASFEIRNALGELVARGLKFGSVEVTCIGQVVEFQGVVLYNAAIGGVEETGTTLVTAMAPFGPSAPVTPGRMFSEVFARVNTPGVVLLTPVAAVNEVGTTHTVTATLMNALGQPVPGTVITFTVTGSVMTTDSCVTDASGMCSVSYLGPTLPGADEITATAANAAPGVATKVWVAPPPPPPPPPPPIPDPQPEQKCTGGGHILHEGVVKGASFGFNAKKKGLVASGGGNFIDHRTKKKIHLVDVTDLLVVGTHATIWGNARVDGRNTTYRIEVEDLGESGRGQDTFSIQVDDYMAGGVLTGGNIQIHKP